MWYIIMQLEYYYMYGGKNIIVKMIYWNILYMSGVYIYMY